MVVTGASHVAVYDWTFLLGQSLMPAIKLPLGTLMYQSRLVPRLIPVIGLTGAPLQLITAVIATLFGSTLFGSIGQRFLLGPARRAPGGCLGVLAGRVAGREGLQALPDHNRNGHCQHAPRLPGRRRLILGAVNTAGHSGARPCCRTPAPLNAHRTRRTGRMATAIMNNARPYTIDAVKTKIFRLPGQRASRR